MKCTRCKHDAIEGRSLCKVHLIRARINQWAIQRPECKPYLPRSDKRGRNASDPLSEIARKVVNKLEEQDYRCAISGQVIDLLNNAEIDHIESINERPDLAFSIENLRWVDSAINKKSNKGKTSGIDKTPEHKLLRAMKKLLNSSYGWNLVNKEARDCWEQIKKDIDKYEKLIRSN